MFLGKGALQICNKFTGEPGADSDVLKRGSAQCRPPWLTDEENVWFQMV